jgi:hypothetical protein
MVLPSHSGPRGGELVQVGREDRGVEHRVHAAALAPPPGARTEETSENEVIRQALMHYFELKRADAGFVARARAMLARSPRCSCPSR